MFIPIIRYDVLAVKVTGSYCLAHPNTQHTIIDRHFCLHYITECRDKNNADCFIDKMGVTA